MEDIATVFVAKKISSVEKREMKTTWKGLRFLVSVKAKDLLIFQFNIDREFV